MAGLSYLRSQLASYQRQKEEAEEKVRLYKQRVKDVKKAIDTLNSTANSGSDDVNNKIKKVAEELESGINYSAGSSAINSKFDGRDDRGTGDANVSDANSELSQELADSEQKLEDAQTKVIYCDNKISRIKAEIRAEERRIEAENRRRAEEARKQREAEKNKK